MAVLTDPERVTLWAKFMSDASAGRDPLPGLTKAEVRAAVDAADDWANANATSFNSALPLAARTNLTARQKAALLMYVIKRRFEVS